MPPQTDFDLPDLPDFLTGHIDAMGFESDGRATTPGAQTMLGVLGSSAAGSDPYADMGLSRNAPCPCGSGQKYKHCHGAA